MKKQIFMPSVIAAGAMLGLVSCEQDNNESLSRNDFAKDDFAKDGRKIITFDFNKLTETQRLELNAFKSFSNDLINSPIVTRAYTNDPMRVLDIYGIDLSQFDQNSVFVKTMYAMTEPEVANAIRNKDLKLYIELLKERGIYINKQLTRAAETTNAEVIDDKNASLFWTVGAVAAVVAVAWAAVYAQVVFWGASAKKTTNITTKIDNKESVSIDLSDTSPIAEFDATRQDIATTLSDAMPDLTDEQRNEIIKIAQDCYSQDYEK